MLVALHLPVYAAHGATRRLFILAGKAFALAISAAFAVGTMIGFGLERTVFGWLGVLDQLIDPYPVQGLGDGLRGILSLTLLSLVYLCCGWLIGSICYRYGAWTGTLMTPVAALPVLVTEAGFGQKHLGEWLAQKVGLSGLPYRTGLIVALGSAAVVLATIYGINRAVPIRPGNSERPPRQRWCRDCGRSRDTTRLWSPDRPPAGVSLVMFSTPVY